MPRPLRSFAAGVTEPSIAGAPLGTDLNTAMGRRPRAHPLALTGAVSALMVWLENLPVSVLSLPWAFLAQASPVVYAAVFFSFC